MKRDAATQLHLFWGLTRVTCAAASLWTSSNAVRSGRPNSLSVIQIPKMHAVGRNGGNNELGRQNDDGGAKIAKIQTAHRLTPPPKSSNIKTESLGPPIFYGAVQAPTEGERSGSLFTPHREGA